ncbi:unnamed protein product [Urochloa humidicola]
MHTRVGGPRSTLGKQKRERIRNWQRPTEDGLKLNVDGAFIKETGEAAMGIIIRNSEGSPELTAWRLLKHCRDAEEAEALACLEGLGLAMRWPDHSLTLETDCASVISKVTSKSPDRSVLGAIIEDIKQAARGFRCICFRGISREQNKVAHELAHLAIRRKENDVLVGGAPACVDPLICNDCG